MVFTSGAYGFILLIMPLLTKSDVFWLWPERHCHTCAQLNLRPLAYELPQWRYRFPSDRPGFGSHMGRAFADQLFSDDLTTSLTITSIAPLAFFGNETAGKDYYQRLYRHRYGGRWSRGLYPLDS